MNKQTKQYILHQSKEHVETTVSKINAGETITYDDIYDIIRNDIEIDKTNLSNIIIKYKDLIKPKPIYFYKDLHYFYSEVNVKDVADYVSMVVGYLTSAVIDK